MTDTAFIYYGTATYDLSAPFITTDRITGKQVMVEGYEDQGTSGGHYGQYINVIGKKQKKDGTFYGRFTTLDIEVPAEVIEAFKAL